MHSLPRVTVVFPTYNEAGVINKTISRTMDAFAGDVGVIVVDDDSPDGTADAVRRRWGADSRVSVIIRPGKTGLASAVADGVANVDTPRVIVADADLQHPPDVFPDLDTALNDADVAIGSRYTDGGAISEWPFTRRFVSHGARSLAKVAIPESRDISDPISGLFAFRREVVNPVDLDAPGYKVLIQILDMGCYDSVVEVPYTFQRRDSGESNLGFREYINFLEHLGQIKSRRHLPFADPERVVRAAEFAAFGAVAITVYIIMFVLALVLGAPYLIAGVIAFAAGVSVNFLGNWLVTFGRPLEVVWRQHVPFMLFIVFLVPAVEFAHSPEVIANVAAISGGSVFNYLGSEHIAFI